MFMLKLPSNLADKSPPRRAIGPGTWLPRVYYIGWTGFHYYVEIDLEEAALLGLDLRYLKPKDATYEAAPLNYEAIRENQITGEKIAF